MFTRRPTTSTGRHAVQRPPDTTDPTVITCRRCGTKVSTRDYLHAAANGTDTAITCPVCQKIPAVPHAHVRSFLHRCYHHRDLIRVAWWGLFTGMAIPAIAAGDWGPALVRAMSGAVLAYGSTVILEWIHARQQPRCTSGAH